MKGVLTRTPLREGGWVLEKRARRRCTGKVSANASARPASAAAALGCPWKASPPSCRGSSFTVLGVHRRCQLFLLGEYFVSGLGAVKNAKEGVLLGLQQEVDVESASGTSDGFGITVSYWRDLESIRK